MIIENVVAFQIVMEIIIGLGAASALFLETLYAKEKKYRNGGKKLAFYINANTTFYLIHVLLYVTVLLFWRSLEYEGFTITFIFWSEVLSMHAVLFIVADRIVKIWALNSKQVLSQPSPQS